MDYRHADNPEPFSAVRAERPVRVKRSRYEVSRVYQVSCRDCNEYIDDYDFTTRQAADDAIRDHERAFHSGD